ncbi:MAG: glycosyltransferase [Clostridia bacterium]|nr:glycosyltransferase [Clostridia bacterium]
MVSIIIPVYNGERYIDRCLGSILPKLTDAQVIAVNDGSRDSSLEMLRKYEEQYKNLLVVDKEQNEGLPQAKKTGLSAATGEYVAFLDVDDWAEPDMYIKMEQKAKESQADLVWCDFIEEFPDHAHPMKSVLKKEETLPMKGTDALRYVHQRRAVFQYPWNKLYRADLLRKIEFPTGNFVGEDYYVTIRYLLMAERVDYVDFLGYHYMTVPNSMSRGGYGPNTAWAYENYQKDYALIREELHSEKKAMCNYLITEYMAFVVAMGKNNTYNKPMIKEIKKFVFGHLARYLFSGSVPMKMKGSAVALCISYRLLIKAYRMMSA